MKIAFKITGIMMVICLASTLSNGLVLQTPKVADETTKVTAFNVTSLTAPLPPPPILTVNDFLINGDPNYANYDDDATPPADDDEYYYEADEYFDGRIVGGNAVSIRQFPFQVSVQYNKAHVCGGAIVAPNLVITAAHCFEKPQNTKLYRVRVGSSQHKHGGQLVGVQSIIPHEQYSPLTLDNDVAIIVLAARLSFNQNVKPVRVAKQNDAVPSKKRLYISGWGITSEMGDVTSVLRSATVRLLNDDVCSQSYRAFTRITPRMFCAGSSSGGRDSCQGDSGGPLISNVRGKPKLFGVISWGIGCAQKGYPGVYAKMSALRPWINEKISALRLTKLPGNKIAEI